MISRDSTPWRELPQLRIGEAAELAGLSLRGFEAALEGGRSIKWVQEILGHSSAELTLRTYAHIIPREDDSLEFLPARKNAGETRGKRGDVAPNQKRRRRK